MRKILYVAVFISGMTTLAVEMAASRLLGNVFGTSNLVWASIIGLILIYLAAGYFLGGYWADRSPHFRTFFQILLWAAFTIGLVPVFSRPVLRLAANAFDQLQLGILFGSFSAVIVLLCIPITLLGTASPFAIRLALQDTSHSGKVSGKIYAISTLGSFIGTFLPTLLLIPTVGTYRTFLLIGGVLLLFSFYGLWRAAGLKILLTYLWMPLLLLALAIWGLPGSAKATAGQIYEAESSYNYIQVLQVDGYRLLRLNEGQGIHSIYHPDQLNYYGPWEQVLVAPFFNPAPYDPDNVNNMAIVGLAAGTAARQAFSVYENIQIDGFEIDPKIVEVGHEYFEMNDARLNVIVQDGRWGLAHSPKTYQVISVDAYRPPYIPWHLTTVEFFSMVRQHLSDDGVMIINIGRSLSDRRLIDTLGSTILAVFPTIHVVDIPNTYNSILFATVQPTSPGNLIDNIRYLFEQEDPVNPLLLDSMQIAAANLQPPPSQTTIFTDDLAPIEWITNNMILEYLIFGEGEQLQ